MASNIRLIKQLFINGKFVNSKSGKTFNVINPATEEVITAVQ
jgi:aldehyde dehydrogenase (NAD+)